MIDAESTPIQNIVEDPTLGKLEEVYPGKNAQLNTILFRVLTIVLGLGGLSLLGYTFLNTYERYIENGPATIIRTLLFPSVISLLLIGAAGFCLWQSLRYQNQRIQVYTAGFMLRSWRGENTWLWKDIGRIQIRQVHWIIGINSGFVQHQYHLTNWNGDTMVLDDRIEGVEVFIDHLREQVIPLLFTRYVNKFNTGKRLVFGPIRIHRNTGIQIGKEVISWSTFKEAAINKGRLEIVYKGSGEKAPLTVEVSDIPNLDVLFSILDQVPAED